MLSFMYWFIRDNMKAGNQMANFLRAPCDDVLSSPSLALVKKGCERWVLIATIFGSSMAFIDGTIVNVALPAIQDALHTSISRLQWVVEAYALTLAALLLVGGALGDIYGRRIIFLLIGVVVFAIASSWCGFAANPFRNSSSHEPFRVSVRLFLFPEVWRLSVVHFQKNVEVKQ